MEKAKLITLAVSIIMLVNSCQCSCSGEFSEATTNLCGGVKCLNDS